jgi:phytoene desaturase
MSRPHMLIIGGGLAALSTGCYALANGWKVTILEHNLALGGVCTAWTRGPYTIDGCIHWLTGGPFARIYEELQIVPPVIIRPLREFVTVRDVRQGWSVTIGADLAALGARLRQIAPDDGEAIDRMMEAAAMIPAIEPQIDPPPELQTIGDRLRGLWELRGELGLILRYRSNVGAWTAANLKSEALRRVLTCILPPEAPMLFLLMMLGYLARGWLSRPIGGTSAFRDALVARYEALGGEVRLDTTVDEVLVEGGRAVGVRVADGAILRGELVVSTSSAPETVLRLLGGRYGVDALDSRLRRWKLFDPIVLASWGVARPLDDAPPMLILEGVGPLELAGRPNERIFVRTYNDEPAVAPAGHTVVQTMLPTDYEWWATRGSRYGDTKAQVAERALAAIAAHLPGVAEDVRVTDVATPLTFWRSARAWRGSFEGWMPSDGDFMTHVPKTLPGLDGFYMAGQWVEPGGGVPAALMSGRQLVQILCAEARRPFVTAP